MTLDFHPAVQRDFNDAVAYYEAKGGPHLADHFEAEFRSSIESIKAGPTRFPFYQPHPRFRRVRLEHFPYLIVYHATHDLIRITLLKHERRHPLFGLQRQ